MLYYSLIYIFLAPMKQMKNRTTWYLALNPTGTGYVIYYFFCRNYLRLHNLSPHQD